ncbi:hypothetical protein BDK51DRAFT_46879 [Blyttiomyces helicus]|uniref:Uncharacterized protein n=1 Tax=Blyttiomyces helicus TaxID=388810 RepID=A0A4P9WE06_9FUNG|nr:hypothetical protein BDK51DRAFT_46879 [Blyttiomyces helicus]|eukprot:RKO89913.1 hypothetical protein BDK51DRAFT_46879 [Blyttiomyces helicus]
MLCTALVANVGRSQGDAVRTIAVDYAFGDVIKLVQYDGFKRHGRGVLLCELSCTAEEFYDPKDMTRPVHRRIRSMYVPESGFAALARLWMYNDSQPMPLDALLAKVDQLDRDFLGQYFVMILACPFDAVQKYQAFLMMNWLTEDHPKRVVISAASVVDWDWERSPDSDEIIITPGFYRYCIDMHAARSERGGMFEDGLWMPPVDISYNVMWRSRS